MQQEIQLQLSPKDAADAATIQVELARNLSISPKKINGFQILKKSIDARKREIKVNLKLKAFVDEPFQELSIPTFDFKNVATAKQQVVIVGAGPAGLFAALELILLGIKPIIVERGKNVRERRRDLAQLNREGVLNEESNYCFGEGGAGTYSDGKLYTRSNKRGSIDKILQLLVCFGADPSILYTAHPHIGTNKLPGIIASIREQIKASGGEVYFNQKVIDFKIENNKIVGVKTSSGELFEGDSVILATGHSAKDIFYLLDQKNILIEPKPFALGVRIEHPQQLIDSIQYHCPTWQGRDNYLPPASYQLVDQVNNRGVFSFCMCPGGIIATASTSQEMLVVNGWSPSKRNNPFANSGMVVQVELEDVFKGMRDERQGTREKGRGRREMKQINNRLILHDFQEMVERNAFKAGGGKFIAPAQRMTDFVQGKTSASLPDTSYLRGVNSADLNEVLPPFIAKTLRDGFKSFGKKMKGYFTEEAIIVAPESRTSSPVRIPRDELHLHHPQIKNLYPCGEGAGYAGGIVSAAMDGIKVASMIMATHQ
jgi:uncharacterized FAD-dependent dehydrogenase